MTVLRRRVPPILATLALAVVLAGCAAAPPAPSPAALVLEPVGYGDLPGWQDDRQAATLRALRRACAVAPAGPAGRIAAAVAARAGGWAAPCAAAQALADIDDKAARRFFERWFVPYRVADGAETAGLFTGYYEPLLRGSRSRSARYSVPLHLKPPELIRVDLGEFRPSLAGRRIAGRVVGGRLRPLPTRAEIEGGALTGRGLEIVWVDDAVDAFFLHIQGSGRVRLEDGTTLRLGYAATNGRPYTAIGRWLIETGAVARENMSMQAIRAWLGANPRRGRALMARNESYVFFRILAGEGPIGASGAVLTAGRSLAVDRRFMPLGAPVWIDTIDPLDQSRPLRRLMVAQDTGGAIRGPVRGDIFWGTGPDAAERAGRMNRQGRYFLLLPRRMPAPPVS